MANITEYAIVLGIFWAIFKLLRIGRREDTLPPGPPTVPILGNAHLLPTKYPFVKLAELGKDYDGIFSLKVANGTIIVVSDMKTVKELLDDRSTEFASRPAFSGMDAVTGGRYFLTASPDSHLWKTSRQAIKSLLSPQAVQKYYPLVDAETTQLLYDILHKPEAFYDHITRLTLSFMTSIVFGQRTPTHDSPVAVAFRKYIEQFFRVFSPEAPPVDFIPALMYVPEVWAPYKKLWKESKSMQRSLYFGLLIEAERCKQDGLNDGCFVTDLLDQQAELGLDRETIVYIGGALLDGGAETTSSFLQNFVLCLVKSPAVLRKAQLEVDNIVGDRIPDSNDIKSMPYVQAIIKETHRLLPIAPTAMPHASPNDCEYRGFIIPKNTPVLFNVFGICRDPNLYERPDEFWPERYILSPNGTKLGHPDDMSHVRTSVPFGSGKRLCPGMFLANNNTGIAAIRLLWAFDFAPSDDSITSKPSFDIKNEFIDGLNLTAKPFSCKITPRSSVKASLIEEAQHEFNIAH